MGAALKNGDSTDKPVGERNFRSRPKKFSSLTVAQILKTRMDEKNIRNEDMAKALGYPSKNVIAMMKTGNMRLPINKAAMAANVLGVDPVFFLGKVIEEGDATLWASLKGVLGTSLVSKNELKLIEAIRPMLDGHDLDLAASSTVMQSITPAIQAEVAAAKAAEQATLERVEREKGKLAIHIPIPTKD